MSDEIKRTDPESVGKAGPQKEVDAGKDKKTSPFGEDVVVGMYLVYNNKLDEWGVIGAPGFLDNRNRAYFALMMAGKNLDDYYAKRKSIRQTLTDGINAFQNKMNFRNFTRFKR